MKKVGAIALILCGPLGAFTLDMGLSAPAFASQPGGSAGSDGDGDHMGAGEDENKDPVTNSGPNFTAKAHEDTKEALGVE